MVFEEKIKGVELIANNNTVFRCFVGSSGYLTFQIFVGSRGFEATFEEKDKEQIAELVTLLVKYVGKEALKKVKHGESDS